MSKFRIETDSLGEIKVPENKLWGAQTERCLNYFNIGKSLMPIEMISAYAIVKKAAAQVNHHNKLLTQEKKDLIEKVCDEIIEGQHHDMFPIGVWISGSGTQFNMNVNEVISNRCCQLAEQPLGSKKPVHPNDDVNMSQSTNDSFPTAMNISAAISVKNKLIPAAENLRDKLNQKANQWKDIIKIGRTHLQDATPLTLGQEFSGYVEALNDNLKRLENTLFEIYPLALGGTAVGTGINAVKGFDKAVTAIIAKLTQLPFTAATNKFTAQGSHDGITQLSATLKTLATSLYKIATDIRLLASGPRAGFNELILPANEPGSSIMPGKVNPTQCEALSMVALQVMANDTAVTLGGASGNLELNVYKPLMIFNIMNSINLMADSIHSFTKHAVQGMKANHKQIAANLNRSLMLVTTLSPVIGYDKAAQIAHHAHKHDLTLKQAALKLGFITEEEFDKVVDPAKMIQPS